MKPGDSGGWTCEHASNNAGPCWRCAPGDGLCKGCGYPLDDHLVVGQETPVCRRKRKVAA